MLKKKFPTKKDILPVYNSAENGLFLRFFKTVLHDMKMFDLIRSLDFSNSLMKYKTSEKLLIWIEYRVPWIVNEFVEFQIRLHSIEPENWSSFPPLS